MEEDESVATPGFRSPDSSLVTPFALKRLSQ